MDVRNFSKRPKLTDRTETTSLESEQLNYTTASNTTTATLESTPLQITDPVEVEPSLTVVDTLTFHEPDTGRYVGQAKTIRMPKVYSFAPVPTI